ncbi:MAG: hypothetical protein AAFO77_04070 [Pseudomonadota bacterium]
MKKLLITAAVVAAAATPFTVSANAAGHSKACDDDTVAMVMEEVEGAPAANKEMAMAEFTMAKEKMEAGMAEECSGHLTKASELSATN